MSLTAADRTSALAAASPPARGAALGPPRKAAAAFAVRRVCLVGAGAIAATHAQVLRTLSQVRIAAVVDPNLAAARRLVGRDADVEVYASVESALADCGPFDAAHVLVPPGSHRQAALPLLQAGAPVLLEKPLAATGAECDELLAAARRSGAILGVNQNFVFHPAFLRLRRALEAGTYGPARFVDCVYHAPLRQLAARQFAHWMFQRPLNLLLEQAVHPLSQIAALAGAVQAVRAIAGPALQAAPGVSLFPTVTATLDCAKLPAQLRYAVGQAYPFWRLTVVCDDGVLVADMQTNRFHAEGRSRWLDAVDQLRSGLGAAGAIAGASLRNFADYARASAGVGGRSDPFFLSMRASIGDFHEALAQDRAPTCDGAFGAGLVAACEAIGAAAFGPPPAARAPRRVAPIGKPDVAVLGGTGFIGAETVRRLAAEGRRVAVMARQTANLPEVFDAGGVAVHQGDIGDPAAVARAIAGAPVVVNLAHGGGGACYEQIRAAMVGGAETVARACLAAGARRLVHVGSIASLYLGPQPGTVTGAAPSDPRCEARADYARAKAVCERMLLDLHAKAGLPVCILRPGLVVGEGASPFHSGLGLFNNEQHCIGWNDGRNPLPFVLVQDVAWAIQLAADLHAPVDGRCYNLVGDVRPDARGYLAALAQATSRPLRFHPSAPSALWAVELAKSLVKRIAGRPAAPTTRRDLLSRGLRAQFDCSDAKRDLGWRPVSDPAVFRKLAIEAHAG